MRIALSTYSMDRRMQEGTLNQFTCIAKAKEMGFDAIEFVDIWPHDGSSREDYAKRLREECQRLDMPVANFAVGADFLRCGDLSAASGDPGDLTTVFRYWRMPAFKSPALQRSWAYRPWWKIMASSARTASGWRN